MNADLVRKIQKDAQFADEIKQIDKIIEQFCVTNPHTRNCNIITKKCDFKYYDEVYTKKGFKVSFVNNTCINLSW